MRIHHYLDPGPSQSRPPPACASRRSSSSLSGVPSRRMSKTPLFLPSPSPSAHSSSRPLPQSDRVNRDPDLLEIISISSSSNSPTPPPRRTPRRTKKRSRQLMTHVLIPPLPPGVRKSEYVPVEQRLRTRGRQATAKGKVRVGDNSGSTDLMHALRRTFANNWSSIKAPGTEAREKRKETAREIVVVLDDDEEEAEEKSKDPTTLDQALAATFMHNSANPNVAA